jgi:hypothetical protein
MRAKVINFTRGQDPLDAMKIGASHEYGPYYRLFLKMHKVAKASKNVLKVTAIKKWKETSVLEFEITLKTTYTEERLQWEPYSERLDRNSSSYSPSTLHHGYLITLEQKSISILDLTDSSEELVDNMEDFCKITKCELNESVNFERGQDPMKAMNIGKDRKIKEGDKFEAYDIKKRKMVKVEAYHDEELRSDEPGQSYRFVEIEIDGRNWFATFDFNHNCWVKGAFDAWGADLDEAVNFERGKNPFRAMEIGTITWNTLQPKDIIVQRNNRDDVFYLVVDIKRHGDKLTLTLAPFGTIAGLLRNLHLRLDPKFFASSVYTKKISTWTKRFKIIQPHELT